MKELYLHFAEQVTESDAVDVAEIAIKRHTSDLTTKAMALIALLKLSSRFPSCSEYVNSLSSSSPVFTLLSPSTFSCIHSLDYPSRNSYVSMKVLNIMQLKAFLAIFQKSNFSLSCSFTVFPLHSLPIYYSWTIIDLTNIPSSLSVNFHLVCYIIQLLHPFLFLLFLPLPCRRIRDIIVQQKGSLVLELQQRSIEFNSILDKHRNIRYQIEFCIFLIVFCHLLQGSNYPSIVCHSFKKKKLFIYCRTIC